jgi:hypothetical protein
VHDVSVKLSDAQAYVLTRAARGSEDLVLSPIPKGRKPATSMSLGGQTEALAAFNFDDVRATPSPAATNTDTATYRTFDGQVIEFTGHRDGDKAFVSVTTRRDPELAAKFPEAPAAKPPAPATPAAPAVAKPAAKPADQTVEKLGARAKGVEFEIPAYKYEAIFRKPEELLEKLPEPVTKPAASKKPEVTKKK